MLPIVEAFAYLPLLLRVTAPLSATASRFIIQRVGMASFTNIASIEAHANIGVLASLIYYVKKNGEQSEKPEADGPILWLDDPASSRFMNPDSEAFEDALVSGDKQPKPKNTIDKSASLPTAPSSFSTVVQDGGGGQEGWAKYKGTSGTQSANVISEFWWSSLDIKLPNIPDYQRCVNSNQAVPAGAPNTPATWCGLVSVNGSTSRFAIWQKTTVVECPTGYQKQSSGLCNLVEMGSVQKPSNIPCELLQTKEGWITDSKNPNCESYESKIKRSIKSVQLIDSDDKGNVSFDDSLSRNDDGSLTFTSNTDTGTVYSTVLKPTGNGSAGYIVSSAGSKPGSTIGTAPGTGSGGTGSGGTGAGSNGNGACGASGLPDCRIDDSGFAGKAFDVSSVKNSLSGASQKFSDTIAGEHSKNYGLTKDNFFPDLRFGLPRTECVNPDLNLAHLGIDLTFDLCGHWLVQLLKPVEAWLLGIYTTYYVWRRFMTAEQVQEVS